jgi:hypothetical protein
MHPPVTGFKQGLYGHPAGCQLPPLPSWLRDPYLLARVFFINCLLVMVAVTQADDMHLLFMEATMGHG